MSRTLQSTKRFARALQRYLKTRPSAAASIRAVLDMLAADAFQPSLQTHKLKGEFAGSWAASAGYDLRIIFHFDRQNGVELIVLETIGSHDVVY
ncbi:MAG: type II toxin-antitoxin system YafQ family toxin [Planctomycetaceae bacterium]|nr:type II toxin-antitoxin system YafQ family toxin [Planctomycetaceae bacterium]